MAASVVGNLIYKMDILREFVCYCKWLCLALMWRRKEKFSSLSTINNNSINKELHGLELLANRHAKMKICIWKLWILCRYRFNILILMIYIICVVFNFSSEVLGVDGVLQSVVVTVKIYFIGEFFVNLFNLAIEKVIPLWYLTSFQLLPFERHGETCPSTNISLLNLQLFRSLI